MHSDLPFLRDFFLIRGGHVHAPLLRRRAVRPLLGARLMLVSPGADGPYTGMMPGHVAGHYAPQDLDTDLVRLARFAGAGTVLDAATGIGCSSNSGGALALSGSGPG